MSDSQSSPDPFPPPPAAGDILPPPRMAGDPVTDAWSPTGAVSFGWQAVKAKPESVAFFFVAGLCGSLLSTAGQVMVQLAAPGANRSGAAVVIVVLGACLMLINIPIQMFFSMNSTRYALRLCRGEPAGFQDLFKLDFDPYWGFFGAAMLIGIAVFCGCLLLIVPGVLLALGWYVALPMVVDGRGGPMAAMRASWEATRGRRGAIFVLILLIFGLSLLGLLACCVGTIVTGAIVNLAHVYTYLKLTGQPVALPR